MKIILQNRATMSWPNWWNGKLTCNRRPSKNFDAERVVHLAINGLSTHMQSSKMLVLLCWKCFLVISDFRKDFVISKMLKISKKNNAGYEKNGENLKIMGDKQRIREGEWLALAQSTEVLHCKRKVTGSAYLCDRSF